MKIQVAVATVGQKDFSLYEKMNIKADAVIANQTDCFDLQQIGKDGFDVCMISTKTKGVGINRHLAINLSDADILLFADDDITYYDKAVLAVKEAFETLSDADVIIFGLDYTKNGEIFDKRHCKIKKLKLWNSLKYGAARIAVKKAFLEKNNISFSRLFGGGCIYGSGEDSIFLCELFRAGAKVYSHTHVLGKCAKDESSWFKGFDEKYMFDKGAFIACAFPKSKHLVKWYFVYKFSKKSEFTFLKTLGLINDGIKSFKDLKVFIK